MFEIVFLGTSASAPSIHRGLSAQVVMAKNHRFLIDCGEGTQRQLLKSGIGFKRLNRILITHGHLDHILGLAGLMSTFMRWESIDYLEIWGGRFALDRVQDLLYGVVLRGAQSPMPLHLIDVKPGVLIEDPDFTVSAFPVAHRGRDCYGYVFQEKPRRPFLVEKAEALGVPAGPERAKLVHGEAITLADGRVIRPDDVLGEDVPGARHCRHERAGRGCHKRARAGDRSDVHGRRSGDGGGFRAHDGGPGRAVCRGDRRPDAAADPRFAALPRA
jgi:ribonuclease Z